MTTFPPSSSPPPSAVEAWADNLAAWGIPDAIMRHAPETPWFHETSRFTVEAPIDRDSLSHRWAREVLPPVGATVLDIGCGGGRSTLPLIPPANEAVGVDTSGAMLDEFVHALAVAGVARRTVHGAWPDVSAFTPTADVVVCHHVVYNVAEIAPFVVALTDHARLAVVVELPVRHPMSAWAPAWRHFWNVARPTAPSADSFVAVLRELGYDPEFDTFQRATPPFVVDPESIAVARRRLCLTPDRDEELATWLRENPPEFVDRFAAVRWPGEA